MPAKAASDLIDILSRGATDPARRSLIIRALQELWPHLEGATDHKMDAGKLDRAEDLRWEPPILCFTIKRNGAGVLGSSLPNCSTVRSI